MSETTPTTRLSRELQVGKAAEHLVCCELILRGFNAFLADAGLPYDVLVETVHGVLRVQVKASLTPYRYERKGGSRIGRVVDGYRFGLRRGRGFKRIDAASVDVFAFVALDSRRIAYLRTSELLTPDGRVVGLVEFACEADHRRWGHRTFQKCAEFPVGERTSDNTKACFRCGEVKPADTEHFTPNKRCRGGVNGICRDCHRIYDAAAKRAQRERERNSVNA